MTYTVRLTDQTLQAIEEQATYIAVECAAPLNAARWLDRVNTAIDSLALWPRRCALAEEDQSRPFEIRHLIVDSHYLVFTIDDEQNTVWIISFRYGGMEPKLGELPGGGP